MVERADDSPPAVDLEVARGPDDRRSHIAREYRIVSRQFTDQARDILGMNDVAVRSAFRERIQLAACFLVVSQRMFEMTRISLVLDRGQNGLHSVLHGAKQAEMERTTIAERLRPYVNLSDLCVLGIKCSIRKIRAKHQQGVAILHGRVA